MSAIFKKRIMWTDEMLRLEALRYDTKDEFQKGNNPAYQAARRRGSAFLKRIYSHMPERKDISGENNPRYKWSFKKLKAEAKKYDRLVDFQFGSPSAYMTAFKRGILYEISKHMKIRDFNGSANSNYRWTDEELRLEALKYDTISDFQEKSGGAYQAAWGRGLLSEICSHMKPSRGSSREERKILAAIKEYFVEAEQLKMRKISILGKKYIKGFDIDIFIPSLGLGIEFDGTYHHSFKGLKRSRPHWPNKDIRNYHEIKDSYFASKDIKILHIKEEDWFGDKEGCVLQIEQFLGITGFMSEIEERAA